MAREVKYICDKCGHSQPNDEQMWEVGIILGHRGFDRTPKLSALWCRTCMEKARLLPLVELKDVEPDLPPPPTLEDLIREIVRSELP